MIQDFSFKSTYDAYLYTKKGKRKTRDVQEFSAHGLENVISIYDDLKHKRYQIGESHGFTIYEPKERLIIAPPFRDRVMHRTLCKCMLEPAIERHLIYDTYSCRLGKGTHAGLYRLEDFLRRYYRQNGREGWIIKGDITKFFYSICHDILKENLYPLFKNWDIEWLLGMIIDGTQPPGLPLGNQTSQWFTNFYMSCFDHFVKEVLRIKFYIRYADDWVAIVETKHEAQEALKKMQEYLFEELNLETNNKTQILPIKNGIDFLGFYTYVTPTGKVIRKLRRDSKEKMMRKLRLYKELYWRGLMSKEEIRASYHSWRGHAKHGSTKGLFVVTDRLYREIFEGAD